MKKNSGILDNDQRTILVVTSVEAEKQAILKSLGDYNRFQVETIGVGPMLAAAKTVELLMRDSYDVVINMGVAGGFPGVVKVGDAVVASEMIAADLGAESSEGFKPIEELGFGCSRFECEDKFTERIIDKINRDTEVKVYLGPILTKSTVTGTQETLDLLKKQVPNATAEAMEGFGVGTAASLYSIPCFEIRTISNLVGPRDRNSWKINEALASLTTVSAAIKEVF